MTWTLVVAYLSAAGIPRIETHRFNDKQTCQARAVKYVAGIRSGSGRAWCVKGVK